MEPYYYSKMNKVQQAAYHAIRQGLLEISDSIQIPGMEAEELYNVFFRLRLDHPEIFWATGYQYKYYDQIRLISYCIPEYLFDKNKIKEHQKATEIPSRKAHKTGERSNPNGKRKSMYMILSVKMCTYDKLKKAIFP